MKGLHTKKIFITCSSIVVLAVIIVLLISGLYMDKEDVFDYVVTHEEELREYISTASFETEKQAEYDGFDITTWDDDKVVQFDVYSFGLVPSTSYSGFVYSMDDIPVGFQGIKDNFIIESDGTYSWTDGTDNTMTIEKIKPNWYWFEARF